MSEETTPVVETTTEPVVETKSAEELKAEVEKYKNEAKDAFEKRDAIKKERDELKGKFQSIEDAEKIASGKTAELLAEKEKALVEANEELTKAKEAETQYNTLVEGMKADLIEQLPDDDHKEIAGKLDLDALRKYVKLNAKKDPTDVDSSSPSNEKVTLTPEQKKEAEKLGMDDADYLERVENRKRLEEELKNKNK